MNVTSCINTEALIEIENEAKKALWKTADAILSDLLNSQTMPLDKGALQNTSTFPYPETPNDIKDGTVSIVSDTPYARRLYFHPEFHFNKMENPNAGGEWFSPYIEGEKKDYAERLFRKFMKI